jgi:hypothetical protein
MSTSLKIVEQHYRHITLTYITERLFEPHLVRCRKTDSSEKTTKKPNNEYQHEVSAKK